jgi:signal transduction histidine kinase
MWSSRPVAWVSPLLYGAVLVTGCYAGFAGLGDTRLVPFIGGLAILFAIDAWEMRRYPERTPTVVAVVLLIVHIGLFILVAAADGAGLSRVLFVLIPFSAYVTWGRTTSIALGAAGLATVAVIYQVVSPGWHRSAEHLTDLLMYALSTVLVIAMAAAAVEERRARLRLEVSQRRIAELSAAHERNRVARDIHDGLGHHLTAVIVQLEKAEAFAERDPRAAREAVGDAHLSARRALDDVRRSVSTLREPFHLRPALGELCGDQVELSVEGDETGFAESTLVTLYRAAQEGVTNARRHAQASRIGVSLVLTSAGADLTVSDDGRGCEPAIAGSAGVPAVGYGLTGMRERVTLAGGQVFLQSEPGSGTRLKVHIPMEALP